MACRYTYQGKTYEAHEFDDVLRAMPPADASKYMPSVKSIATAPFVTNTDKWLTLALKRVVKMAVDGGYDKVAFVNGEQSADRYDLSKQVDFVSMQKHDGNYSITAHKDNREIASHDVKNESEAADVVGKEVAAKLFKEFVDPRNGGIAEVSGDGLKVGGTGMKSFYDKIVPNTMNALLKKLGGIRMETVSFNDATEMAESRKRVGGGDDGTLNTKMANSQPGFTITDAMKEKASGGMPLFAREAAQTETPAFKAWFGDSKVVDAQGKPLVVYHSTSAESDFSKFNKRVGDIGNHFGTLGQAEDRLSYTNKFGSEYKNPRIIPVYLSIKRPLRLKDAGAWNASNLKFQLLDIFPNDATRIGSRWGNDGIKSTKDIREFIKSKGYDGVVYKNIGETAGADEYRKAVQIAKMKFPAEWYGKSSFSTEDQKQPFYIAYREAEDAYQKFREDAGEDSYITFDAAQIKSAIGNNGDFDASNPDIRFSRAAAAKLTDTATDKLNEYFSTPGKLSWWHESFGTMYNLAERSPAFKPVFDAAQGFINDTSYYATEAADMAPKILPKLENWADLAKSPISPADNKAVSAPVFEGTLSWARDEFGKPVKLNDLEARYKDLTTDDKGKMLLKKRIVTEDQLKRWMASPLDIYDGAVNNRFNESFLKAGVLWTDAELTSIFKLTPAQIELYREFRAATDNSLDNMAKAEMLRFGGKDVAGLKDAVMDSKDADEASLLLRDYLMGLADVEVLRKDELLDTANGMIARADKITKLKAEGYAPLSRFGKYSVDVVVNGERQYFGLHESMRDANIMAMKMRAEFGAANVSQGTLSEQQFKLFAGITPESLELFGNMLGLDSTGNEAQDKAFQNYLKLTKTNRSAMRRLIHRKGIAGFSKDDDMGRVLASFIYSNARQTSAALNMGELSDSIQSIPKEQGELKDAAISLAEYIKNPQEEAQAIRGLLFAQYLGGSIASAFVNMTQPFAVSFPWLSQFGGAKQSGAQLVRAMKDMAGKNTVYEPDLAKALNHAEEMGIVSPQEIHQLMAQARGAGTLRSGDGTKLGDASAKASNAFSKLSLGWGKVFGMAEQMNRRSTFIAAYRIAKAQNMANPAAFAEKAVNETQFVYSKANKMRFGRGAVGGTIMTFKTYSIAYMELLHRMYTQGGPEGKKAVLLAMAVMMLMGGAGGLPFEDDILDLVDGALQKLGYNVSSKKAKQQFLEDAFGKAGADFVERGISGLPGMPIDVSGRLGMGNLIPGTGLLMQKTDHTRDVVELVGPVGDLVKRGFDGAGKVLNGDVGGAALAITPTAIRNAAKGAEMGSTGQYKDANGYKVIETTPLEAALKAVGFQPATVAKVQESNYLNQRAKDFYAQTAADIRSKWAKGIVEKDPELIKSARDALANWNEKNPDQKMTANLPAIFKRARDMSKSKEQRIIDTAPKSMRMQMKRDLAEAG